MPELTDNPRLLDKIREHCLPCFANVPPQEGEFMIRDYIAAHATKDYRMSRSTAERRLEGLIADGVITIRKGTYNGKQVNVYRFKE